jgi:hypothetical protein
LSDRDFDRSGHLSRGSDRINQFNF